MAGVRLDPSEVMRAGEAMAAAVARIDATLTVGATFIEWDHVGPTVADQVAALARAVHTTCVLHAASESVGEVILALDRGDLVAALKALAAERADDEDQDGEPYRELAARLRGEVA